MRVRSLFDEKKKARVREAIAKGDTSIFGKKKAEPEHAKKAKVQLSPEEQKELDADLSEAIITALNPDAVKDALEKGANPDSVAITSAIVNRDSTQTVETLTVLGATVHRWYREKERSIIDKPENWKRKEAILEACGKIIELLVTYGANPNVLYDKRPILVYFRGDRMIYDLLKRHGAKE